MRKSTDNKATSRVRTRYDRIAGVYDAMESLVERLVFRRWRQRLWSLVPAGQGLEVGVGTGKNISYYPAGEHITAVDLSPRMLVGARRRAAALGADVKLLEMDAERLDFPDNTFDWAVATFVFCSVPDPVQGLREPGRVVKPEGRVFLLEHVRIDKPVIGKLMDIYNPVAVRISGANINRQTVQNVMVSGLKIEAVEDLGPLGVAKLITVRP